MDKRVASISIIVEDTAGAAKINELLHTVAPYIVGRMGIPYREKNISIINVVMDAPQDIINGVSGRLGKLEGVTAKTTYAKR